MSNYNRAALSDNQNNVIWSRYGEVLRLLDSSNISMNYLIKVLKRPDYKARFRLFVLNPDETIDYEIPEEDIIINSGNFTENYQNGQRKSVNINLINIDGKYTPSINTIWVHSKFRFDIGLEFDGGVYWFPRGIYILGNPSSIHQDSDKQVSLSLVDKFAVLEGRAGTLEATYEIPEGSLIKDAIIGILTIENGSGNAIDLKPIIYDAAFEGKTMPYTLSKDAGSTLGEMILEIGTILNAEVYYNSQGNLCFININETTLDSQKTSLWDYSDENRDYYNASVNYDFEDSVNEVHVVGDNIDNAIFSAVAKNNNPKSPLCIERVGRRIEYINDSDIYSNDLAQQRADYELRKYSILKTTMTIEVSFNPLLFVNNLLTIYDSHYGINREKYLIQSISYNIGNDNKMSISCSNIINFTSLEDIQEAVSNIYKRRVIAGDNLDDKTLYFNFPDNIGNVIMDFPYGRVDSENAISIESEGMTLRNIQVGDDLSGKTLHFNFFEDFYEMINPPESIGYESIITTESSDIRQSVDTDTLGSIYTVGIKNGDDFYRYQKPSTQETILDSYTLPDNFGVVTSIDTTVPAYNYILVETPTVITNKFIVQEKITRSLSQQNYAKVYYTYNTGSSWETTPIYNDDKINQENNIKLSSLKMDENAGVVSSTLDQYDMSESIYEYIFIEDEFIRPIRKGDCLKGAKLYFTFPRSIYNYIIDNDYNNGFINDTNGEYLFSASYDSNEVVIGCFGVDSQQTDSYLNLYKYTRGQLGSLDTNLSVFEYDDSTFNILRVVGEITNSDLAQYVLVDTRTISEYTEFSTQSTYDVGDIVVYEGNYYICIKEVTVPGEWTGVEKTERRTVEVGDDLSGKTLYFNFPQTVNEGYEGENYTLIEANNNRYIYFFKGENDPNYQWVSLSDESSDTLAEYYYQELNSSLNEKQLSDSFGVVVQINENDENHLFEAITADFTEEGNWKKI